MFDIKTCGPCNDTIKFINCYKAHCFLWDPRHPDFNNNTIKDAALLDMRKSTNTDLTEFQLVKKLNQIWEVYRQEKHKIAKRREQVNFNGKYNWLDVADLFYQTIAVEIVRKHEQRQQPNQKLGNKLYKKPFRKIHETSKKNQLHGAITNWKLNENINNLTSDRSYSPNLSGSHTVLQSRSELEENIKPDAKWSSKGSLYFVKFLILHPKLLYADESDWQNEELVCLEKFAKAMKFSIEKIHKKLFIFKNIVENIQKQKEIEAGYKPGYVWWSLFEKAFLSIIQTINRDPTNIKKSCAFPKMFLSKKNDKKEVIIQYQLENKFISKTSPRSNASFLFGKSPVRSDHNKLSTNRVNSKEFFLESTGHRNRVAPKTFQSVRKVNLLKTKAISNSLDEDLIEGKWSLKNSVKFLRLYGSHRCLWNLQDTDYRSRILCYAALKDIAAEMGNGLDVLYVAKKIKILRITYMQHRKGILNNVLCGKEPKLHLKWFPLADSFLRPHIGLRSIKDHQKEIPQYDLQYVYSNLNLVDPSLLLDLRQAKRKKTRTTAATN